MGVDGLLTIQAAEVKEQKTRLLEPLPANLAGSRTRTGSAICTTWRVGDARARVTRRSPSSRRHEQAQRRGTNDSNRAYEQDMVMAYI